jgi:hypothetical protein
MLSCVESCSGKDATTSVELIRVPVLACREGAHPRRWAHPDFGALFIEQIYRDGLFPVAKGGVRPACRQCGVSLSTTMPGPGRVRGSVCVAGLAPFDVSVSSDIFTCPGCGFRQADCRPPAEDALSEALANAFDSGGLRK